MTPRSALIPLVALLAVAVLPSAAFARQSLHGKWTAKMTADEGGRESTDTIEFTKGDQVTSDQMTKEGFEPAAYLGRASPIGAAEQFEATQKNKAGDTAKWQGQNLGGQVTGTLTITRKDGSTASYTFTATRKP